MKIIVLVILSLVSSILYRLGGIGKPFNTKVRDLGCPTVFVGALLLYWLPVSLLHYLMLFLMFGSLFGSLTTYLDSVFGWDNFWAAGFLVGISSFPLIWCGIPWWTILIRAVVLAVGWGAVNCIVNNSSKIKYGDWIEECFRGWSLISTLPILFI